MDRSTPATATQSCNPYVEQNVSDLGHSNEIVFPRAAQVPACHLGETARNINPIAQVRGVEDIAFARCTDEVVKTVVFQITSGNLCQAARNVGPVA